MKKAVIDCSKPQDQQQSLVDLTQEEIDAAAAAYQAGLSIALKAQAQAALDDSDMTALRCVKAGVAFPQEWKDYVTALRAIVESGTGTIPDQPAYPEGT